jgi:hypothetical protein
MKRLLAMLNIGENCNEKLAAADSTRRVLAEA